MGLGSEARKSFAKAIKRLDPGLKVDAKGYVHPVERNFSALVPVEKVRGDFGKGAGNEFIGEPPKIAAAHSSAALAVNAFGPWRLNPQVLHLCGQQGYDAVRFEERCPILRGGTPPHLDLIAESDSLIVAVESKCTEYLRPKSALFKEAYERFWKDRADCSWRDAMRGLQGQPDRFRYLDAAQLIKHYMGLRRRYESGSGTPYRTGRIVLLCLYWEPSNADRFQEFVRHREEIGEFGGEIGDDIVEFDSMSYAELWRAWERHKDPLVGKHVDWLRSRYEFSV